MYTHILCMHTQVSVAESFEASSQRYRKVSLHRSGGGKAGIYTIFPSLRLTSACFQWGHLVSDRRMGSKVSCLWLWPTLAFCSAGPLTEISLIVSIFLLFFGSCRVCHCGLSGRMLDWPLPQSSRQLKDRVRKTGGKEYDGDRMKGRQATVRIHTYVIDIHPVHVFSRLRQLKEVLPASVFKGT